MHELYDKAPRHKGGLLRASWWEEFKFPLRKDYQYAVYYDEQGTPKVTWLSIRTRPIDHCRMDLADRRSLSWFEPLVASHKGSM